jgi:glycosyltransferase involved in cell wall biosynthesis
MQQGADQVEGDAAQRERAGTTGPCVLQVLPALDQGGVERGTLDIARYLTRQGWRALVASSGGTSEAELGAIGATHLGLPLHSKNPLTIRANATRLERLIREHGVQLVHARSRAPAWSAYYAARRCGIPLVTTFHGLYRGIERPLKRRYNSVMARGDRVIAISDHVARHVQEHYGVPEERLRTIHRGVDLEIFDPGAVGSERVAALAELWRVPPDTKVIMLPARLARRKGHILLVEAVQRMSRHDFVCLMVGPLDRMTGYTSEVELRIGATSLGGVVRLVGGCGDMPAAHALADVVVAPSIEPEPFGRVAIEAQAMGRPVVVADIGGLTETVMPAVTGWLVPPNDARELARALELALAMPDDARARLAVRARRFVGRNFTLEQMGRATLNVYRELLDAPPRGPTDPALA